MKAIVSDHALLRFLERIHGINVERYRQALADLVQPAVDVAAAGMPLGDHWIILDGSKVVTVRPARPGVASYIQNDAGNANGTGVKSPKLHWKAKRRMGR